MSFIDTFTKAASAVKQKRIPYNYVVGGKESSSIPFDVRVSLDPDAKKTILVTASILSTGLAIWGIGSYLGRRQR